MKADKKDEIEAQQILKDAKKRAFANMEQSEQFIKMRAEWEALQKSPSDVDDQIRAQLAMLEQINNNAFGGAAAGDGEAGPQTNSAQIGKMVQEMMQKQRATADGQASVTAAYRSRGEPFQDP